MNALPGHIAARQLALRPIDPYEGIPPTDSHVAVSLLARTFAIRRKALADGLRKTDGGSQMHDRLRFCTACMALAHHGVMHQRVSASRCPRHGVWPTRTGGGPGAARAGGIRRHDGQAPHHRLAAEDRTQSGVGGTQQQRAGPDLFRLGRCRRGTVADVPG